MFVHVERLRVMSVHGLFSFLSPYHCQVYRGELTDCYRRRNQAVDAICLGVRPKECFGLLGINGGWVRVHSRVQCGH